MGWMATLTHTTDDRWRAGADLVSRDGGRIRAAETGGEAGGGDAAGPLRHPQSGWFFAVSSECLFERPRALRERHPELYRVLADFCCQDTASWLPDAVSEEST